MWNSIVCVANSLRGVKDLWGQVVRSLWGGVLRLSVGGGMVASMKRTPDRPNDADFAMWMVERWEVMNLQLSELAVTFIGFLGVELALISQANPEDFIMFNGARLIGIAAISSLLLAIMLFLWVIVSEKFNMPGSASLRDFLKNEPRGNENPAEYFLLTTQIPEEDIFSSLEKENANLNRTYMPGIYFSILGQFLIGVLLIARWIQA